MHTSDGGRNWDLALDGLKVGFESVSLIESKICAVGGTAAPNQGITGEGIIVLTDDKENWNKQKEARSLFAVHFVSKEKGWVVGKSGIILHTKDGGRGWKKQLSNVPTDLYDVFFLDEKKGWIVGGSLFSLTGVILRTVDGGENWKSEKQSNPLFGVYFVDEMRGWAVGRGMLILHTEDGGKTWEKQPHKFRGWDSFTFNALVFINAEKGWVIGDRGLIIHTKDGGENWESQKSGIGAEQLKSIAFDGIDTLWVTGDKSMVLRYIDPELNRKSVVNSQSKLLTTWSKLKTALYPNYPNPSNPETWIPFQLAQDASVTISIYNTKGHLVRTILLGNKNAGVYTTKKNAAYWNGHNNAGEKVASGIYFYQFKAGNFAATRRMLVVK